jgi:site-specific recombinase XerD
MVRLESGIGRRVSTHKLRKSAADIWLREGMTIHQVAHLTRTTEVNILRSYSHLDHKAFGEKFKSVLIAETDDELPTGDLIHLSERKKEE